MIGTATSTWSNWSGGAATESRLVSLTNVEKRLTTQDRGSTAKLLKAWHVRDRGLRGDGQHYSCLAVSWY